MPPHRSDVESSHRPQSGGSTMEQSHVLGDDLPLSRQQVFDRLARIPGYSWDPSSLIAHSSYDYWYIAGVKNSSESDPSFPTPVSSSRSKDSTGSNYVSPRLDQHAYFQGRGGGGHASEADSVVSSPQNGSEIGLLPVVARLSSHVIRLEREFHMLRSIIETSDPESEHTVQPIDIIRLSPQPGDSMHLLVVLYEHPGPNNLDRLVDFGPACFGTNADNENVERVPVNQITLSTFLDFAIGACECLELLHYGLKTVHGEIRPDAFHFTSETGTVKLSNSGNGSRAFDNALSDGWSALSRELGAKNKLQYIAPEQTGRLPTEPDSRTDVYALGVVFWSILVGHPAFDGNDPVEVVQNVLGKKLAPVTLKRIDVPNALARIIDKMTQKQSDERYHTVSSVKWDLQQVSSLLGDGDSEALKNFESGQRDISSFFTLPTSMFGRQDEFQQILDVINKLEQHHRISQLQPTGKQTTHQFSAISSGSSRSSDRIDNADGGDASSDSGSYGLTSSRNNHTSGSNLFVPNSTQESTHSADSGTSTTPRTDPYSNRMKSPADSRVSWEAADREGPQSSIGGSLGQFDGLASLGRRKVQEKYRHGGRCEVVTISGTVGLGKSDLIQRVQPEVRKQGYIAVARLDRSRRIPFEPFKRILASLLRQMFSERDVTTQYHVAMRTILRPFWADLHEDLGLPEQLIYSLASSNHPQRVPSRSIPLQVLKEGVEAESNSSDPRFTSLSRGQTTKDFCRGPTCGGTVKLADIIVDVLKVMSLYKLTCICLEDIQYADEESSQLLLDLTRAKVRCLIMLTGRQDDISTPDMKALFDSDAPNVTRIELRPLTEEEVLHYVAATMHQEPNKSLMPLTAVVMEKSRGNPFYVRAMLETCHRKNCIWYCWKDSMWLYDIDRIFAEFVTPNYWNDFIARRFEEIPQEARLILVWASLLGSPFSFSLVQKLLSGEFLYSTGDEDEDDITCPRRVGPGYSESDIVSGLQFLLQSYIILPGETDDEFRFAFDRYAQAVAAMKGAYNTEKMHFIVAQAMMKYCTAETDLYSQAHHICLSANLIKERVSRRIKYRDALYQAALAASKSGAKPTSLVYYQSCLFLLQDNAWDSSGDDVYYDETREMHMQTAEWYFSQEQTSDALKLLDIVFANARTPACKARPWILRSRIYALRKDMSSALDALLASLTELGVHIDTDSSWEYCDAEFVKLRSFLNTIDLDQLFARPLSQDRALVAIGEVMSEAMGLCVWGEPLMFFRLAVEMMNVYAFRGAFSQITFLCTHLATIAISRFKDMELGTRLSDTALMSLNSYKEPPVLARGVTIHNYFINHLRVPMSSMLPVLENSMEAADVLGERHLILINIAAMAFARLSVGHDLAEVEALCNYGLENVSDWMSDLRGGVNILAVRQAARALQGKTYTDSPDYITSDEQHDEQKYISHIISKGANFHSLNTYHSMILVPLFLFGHHERVVEIGTKMMETLHGLWSLRSATMTYFYLSLAILTIHLDNPTQPLDAATLEQVRKYKEEVDFNRNACDANYGMWSMILDGLLREIDGDFPGTVECYEDALDHTQLHGFPFEEALAYELQVDFFIRRGAKRAAQALLHRAIASWNAISATGKVKQLSAKHEWLLRMGTVAKTCDTGCQTVDSLLNIPRAPEPEEEPTRVDPHLEDEHKQKWLEQSQNRDDGCLDISGVGLDIIDLSNILEFSHVMSSELQIDKLLTKMVGIILESCSGSDHALVITESKTHGWCVAAAGDTENGEEAYTDGLPFSEVEHKMAQQITHYTLRTREPVLVHNVIEDERFANVSEAYAARNPQGRSVIALPIIQANNLLGVIHIEGKPNSFTHRNLVVLRLVCNQVGISLSNAFLFQEARTVSAANAAMVEAQKRALSHAREAEQKAKIAEAEAKHNVKLKEDAAKAKSVFLANVSHDLRTPMNGVIGLSEMLKETKLDNQQDSYVESIRVCADTLLTLINDILDFSKLEAGKMKVTTVPLNLRETIAEVVRALSYTHRERGLETVEDLDGIDPNLLVMGDPVRLHQIFMNLLSNSYKFTPKGSVIVRGVVDYDEADKISVTCTIADTGIGISEEQLVRLFKPFSQADSNTHRSYGGSGLGLSICKAIIEDVLGGEIWLKSDEGKGTTVIFTLPFTKAADGGKPHSNPRPDGEALPQRHVRDLASIPRDRIRVCIAEDNPINQKIAVTFVENLGLASEVFSDGEQAVAALKQRSKNGNQFHLVLMDVQMPVLDGYSATRKIRADDDPNVNEVLVIAMTASAIEGDRERCIEAGMNNYLAKPVKSDGLRSMLDQYLAPQQKWPHRRRVTARAGGKHFVSHPALRVASSMSERKGSGSISDVQSNGTTAGSAGDNTPTGGAANDDDNNNNNSDGAGMTTPKAAISTNPVSNGDDEQNNTAE